MRWSGMLSVVDRISAPERVVHGARAVLRARQVAEADAMGMDVDERVYEGDAVADTLIDVIAGVWLWSDIGAPRVYVVAPLAPGSDPPPPVLPF